MMKKIEKEALRVPRIKKHVQDAISYFCLGAAVLLAAVVCFFLTARLQLWLRLVLEAALLAVMGLCLAAGLRVWNRAAAEAQKAAPAMRRKKKK